MDPSETRPNKRIRKKSIVWEHFTVENVSADCTRAICNQCKKSFAYINGLKVAGTSHLKRHITQGSCPVSRQRDQLTPYTLSSINGGSEADSTKPPKRRYITKRAVIDQDSCNHELAKMIIKHGYPLNIVDHPGFIDFLLKLQPEFNIASFNTIQGDCVAIYLKEKQKLLNFLNAIPGRVCLSLDFWTSDQTVGYVSLTGHFIDGDWKLHRRLLSVVMAPFPDSDDALTQAVDTCVSDWGLDKRLFTLTIDQVVLNETRVGNLRGLISIKNPLMLNGQFLVGNCYARFLSRLAQEALGIMSETVEKVRDSVKFVKTSETHEEKFTELKQQLQVPSMKTLFIDDHTKWDTTFHMLVAACELKEVFACLDTSDPDYKETPSMDEWKKMEILLTYLKHLYESVHSLTSQTCQTTNFFFHEAWKIQLELTHAAATCQDPFIRSLMQSLQEQFDKYWNNSCLFLATAVAMDPRFKLKLVEFSLSKIYGDDSESWVKLVDDGIHALFLEYGNISKSKINQEEEEPLSDFDAYISETTSSDHSKSELDQYLDESLLPRELDFDILGWWKLNKSKYPKLSRMASELLSIPVSTAAPDSVFDMVGKKMSSYQCSLHPGTLEALICAKDWLQYGS